MILDDCLVNFRLQMDAPIIPSEPNDSAVRIRGEVVLTGDDNGEHVAGTVRAYLVSPCDGEEHGFNLWDILDDDGVLAEYLSVVDDAGEWSPQVQEICDEACSGTQLLIVDRLEVDQKYRGNRLGLLAIRKLIDILGEQCSIVVIKPIPLQFLHYKDRDWVRPEGMDDPEKAFEAARRTLAEYWGIAGFEPLEGTELLVLNPGLRQPSLKELADPRPAASEIGADPFLPSKEVPQNQRLRHSHKHTR